MADIPELTAFLKGLVRPGDFLVVKVDIDRWVQGWGEGMEAWKSANSGCEGSVSSLTHHRRLCRRAGRRGSWRSWRRCGATAACGAPSANASSKRITSTREGLLGAGSGLQQREPAVCHPQRPPTRSSPCPAPLAVICRGLCAPTPRRLTPTPVTPPHWNCLARCARKACACTTGRDQPEQPLRRQNCQCFATLFCCRIRSHKYDHLSCSCQAKESRQRLGYSKCNLEPGSSAAAVLCRRAAHAQRRPLDN